MNTQIQHSISCQNNDFIIHHVASEKCHSTRMTMKEANQFHEYTSDLKNSMKGSWKSPEVP